MKAVIAVCGLLMLGGCATDGHAPWVQGLSSQGHCAKLDSDQEFAINMAQNLADEGRLHASLANLEELPADLGEVRLRKARVLRQLGSQEAEPLYSSLLGTCRAAQGEHGLGQIAAARGDYVQAQQHLQRASKLAPTDEKIRNDLGVAYLNQLKLEQARFQFLTAIELKPSDNLPAQNLVALLIYQDHWQQAAELTSRAGLSPSQVSDAQRRAEQLKTTPKVSAAATQAPLTAGVETSARLQEGVRP